MSEITPRGSERLRSRDPCGRPRPLDVDDSPGIQIYTRESEHTPMTLYDQVTEAAIAIRAQTDLKPAVGIVLGSGLGDLANEVQDARAIPYAEIPHFLRSTVHGHAGRLLLGRLEDV